jgi:hypothetical protein
MRALAREPKAYKWTQGEFRKRSDFGTFDLKEANTLLATLASCRLRSRDAASWKVGYGTTRP